MEEPPPLNFTGHVAAIPYPSRGHVNPMLNLCKLLASRDNNLLITMVVTEEWHGFIESETKTNNIRFATIPNVIPLQSQITEDIPGFFQATITNMEAPFEKVLESLEQPVTAIVGDVELKFPVAVGRRRNVPVAVLWTMSASFYLVLHQLEGLTRDQRLKVDLLDNLEDQIQGVSSAQLSELQILIRENDLRFLQIELECISTVPKADCLIVNTIQELEAEAINYLKAKFTFPIYPIIAFPYFRFKTSHSIANSDSNSSHIMWLNSQPSKSVLYISFGSFLSLSNTQLDEIVSALNTSGVRYFWVALGEASWLKEKCGEKGLVVPWCDQLKVLSHHSIGGFWSHCGWNSTLEAVFAGIPMLTFPLFFDQVPNRRKILEDWKNGWEFKREGFGSEELITQEEILEVIGEFMDIGSKKGEEIWDSARQLKGVCDQAIVEGGSSNMNLNAFIRDILCVQGHSGAREIKLPSVK